MERRQVAGVSDVVFGLCIMSKWRAGGQYKNMGSCEGMMSYAAIADEKLNMDTFICVAFEKKGVNRVE